jgi:hypothetical protein
MLRAGLDMTTTDILVYGGTAAGIAAGVQAARMGKAVAIVEPGRHLGGLTTGGLGATDIGNKAAIGGIAREFYERVHAHYAKPESWTWEKPDKAALAGQEKGGDPIAAKTGRPTRWTFEPHVAAKILREMLDGAGLAVDMGRPIERVEKKGGRIREIVTVGGRAYRARMFIDATYEADLMALAGVSYHVGRESNATFGETLNGIRAETPHHQFNVDVDPYAVPGDPSSGLIPLVQRDEGGQPGDGDRCVQAYNIRLCMTRVPENRISWTRPEGYDEGTYELLARYVEARVKAGTPLQVRDLMNPVPMPNGKTDTNNNGPVSTDFIGMNYAYPEAGPERRDAIRKAHEDYIRGLLWFLASSPRVPQALRDEMSAWGLAKDEFAASGGISPQMYVREARRMISGYVMTERECRGTRIAPDPVGLGAYNMDSHNCRRIARNGRAENEGDVQVGVKPYGISYRSIVPAPDECDNLFVPVALSASHIAYGSIRMEPVFMILAQSAATAVAMAIEAGSSVQAVDYAKLRERLLADQQVLTWP